MNLYLHPILGKPYFPLYFEFCVAWVYLISFTLLLTLQCYLEYIYIHLHIHAWHVYFYIYVDTCRIWILDAFWKSFHSFFVFYHSPSHHIYNGWIKEKQRFYICRTFHKGKGRRLLLQMSETFLSLFYQGVHFSILHNTFKLQLYSIIKI